MSARKISAQQQSSYRLHAGGSGLGSVLMDQNRAINHLQKKAKQLKQKLSEKEKIFQERESARFNAEVHTEIFVKALRRATASGCMGRDYEAGGYDAWYSPKPPAYLAPQYDPLRASRKAYNNPLVRCW